jgi:O-antigen/teichoic acid export membrane protein
MVADRFATTNESTLVEMPKMRRSDQRPLMLIRHSFIYVSANLLTGAFSLLTTVALTRLLTPGSYGTYGLGFAIIGFASAMFFDWHAVSFLRFSHGHGDREEAMATFVFLFGALMGVATAVFSLFYGAELAPSYDSIIVAALIGTCASGWFQFVVRVQTADLRAGWTFWMNFTRVSSTLVLSLGAAYFTKSAVCVLLATAFGQIAGSLLYPLRGFSLDRRKFSPQLASMVLRFGYPLAISTTLGSISVAVSCIMLDRLASTEAVGRFTAANLTVQTVLALLAGGIAQATFPLAIKAVESGDAAALRAQLIHNYALLLGTLLPAAIGLTLIAPNLAPLLVGHEFVDSVIVLTPWMAAGAVLAGMRAQYFDFAFQLGHKTGYLVLILSSTAILNVVLNALLIPRYGEEGSAMALVFALVPSLTLAVTLGRRAQPMPIPLKITAQIVLASLVMTASLIVVSQVHGFQGLIMQLLVGVTAYAATLVAVDVLGIRAHIAPLVREFTRSMRHSPHDEGLREERRGDA